MRNRLLLSNNIVFLFTAVFFCLPVLAAEKVSDETLKERGFSPLMFAARNGDLSKVKTLLKQNVKVNHRSNVGVTALLLSVSKKHYQIVKILLDSGADPNIGTSTNMFPLHPAAINGDKRIVLLLIRAGAKVNIRTKKGYLNDTPLHWAVGSNQLSTARELIRAGAKVNVQDEQGITPLIDAASYGNKKMVRLLIDSGANPDLKDKKGRTALGIAIRNKHIEIINIIKK